MRLASECKKCVEFYTNKVWTNLRGVPIDSVKMILDSIGVVCECADSPVMIVYS